MEDGSGEQGGKATRRDKGAMTEGRRGKADREMGKADVTEGAYARCTAVAPRRSSPLGVLDSEL